LVDVSAYKTRERLSYRRMLDDIRGGFVDAAARVQREALTAPGTRSGAAMRTIPSSSPERASRESVGRRRAP
jgi:hypothetical protein